MLQSLNLGTKDLVVTFEENNLFTNGIPLSVNELKDDVDDETPAKLVYSNAVQE